MVGYNDSAFDGTLVYAASLTVGNSNAAQYPLVTTISQYGAKATNTGNVYLPQTPEAFAHDADGNLTQDGRWDYTWDGENRLIALQTRSAVLASGVPEQRLEFAYDPQSRRISKTVSNKVSGAWSRIVAQRFLYDGWNLLAILNPQSSIVQSFAWRQDLSGSLQGAGGVGGLLWVGDATTINGQPSAHAACYDGNGNVTALVNFSDASLSARYECGPFGEPIRLTGVMADANALRFSTKLTDAETGMLYYGYRFYYPSIGRWLNRDPIDEKGGVNLYGFLSNDPLDYIDTDGRFTGSKCPKCGQWYQGFHTCPPPIDCSGYSKLGGASCEDCGKVKKDKYPEQAQSFCEGFKKIYTGSSQQVNAVCVASCLVNAEKGCQSKYQDCERRNCCRLLAHVKCYAQCFFVGPLLPPFDGAPPGAWDFGGYELFPACRSLLPELPPGWPPSY